MKAHATAETGASHAVCRVPVVSRARCVREVLEALVGRVFDSVETVYLVDESGRVESGIPLVELLAASPAAPLLSLRAEVVPHVPPDVDQERIAHTALLHGLAQVPLVDAGGHLLGVVPAHALLRILHHEHTEDMHRLAGIERATMQARHAFELSPRRRAADRLPWLLVGLLGSVLATAIVARFERALEARIEIAFFVPGIVYMADAIGTQTEAVAVRGLSICQRSLRVMLREEAATGLLIGLVLAAMAFVAVALAFRQWALALAVGLSLLVASATASAVGLLFPWLLARCGKDPALGSGPLATILQDVLSLVIYFALASVLVR